MKRSSERCGRQLAAIPYRTGRPSSTQTVPRRRSAGRRRAMRVIEQTPASAAPAGLTAMFRPKIDPPHLTGCPEPWAPGRWGPIPVFDGADPVGIRLLARLIRNLHRWRSDWGSRDRLGAGLARARQATDAVGEGGPQRRSLPAAPAPRAPTAAPLRLGPVAERPCYPPAPMRSCKHGPQCALVSGRCWGRNPHPMPPRTSRIPASVPLGADAFFKASDTGGLRSCWTTSRSAPMI